MRTPAAAPAPRLNVAIDLARLGLRVGYISRFGDDSFGRHLAHTLDREGIDRSQVEFDPQHPTGFMLKSRSDDGSDPKIEYFRRGSAASRLGPSEPLRASAARARHLHLTGIYVAVSDPTRDLVHTLARDARAAGRSISFDPNLRPALWRSSAEMVDGLNRLAALADWILPGLDEGRLLTGCNDAPASPPTTSSAARAVWSSSSARTALTGPPRRRRDASPGWRSNGWSIRWAPATASRSASSRACSKASHPSLRPSAATPSGRGWSAFPATATACRRGPNSMP